jgi:hypothetical protein
MTSARSIKTTANREIRIAKRAKASDAIGTIKKGTDTFILTFGQFSLIDALVAILDQVGQAEVTICTWTAAHADLTRSAGLMESAQISRLRMIVDGSFETRKPEYCAHMRQIFGDDCIRAIKTHAKFLLIRSATHDIVVRTSMNLNENPRMESLEVSEDLQLAEFFETITEEIFAERPAGNFRQVMPKLDGAQESFSFPEVEAGIIKREDLNEPATSHALGRAM